MTAQPMATGTRTWVRVLTGSGQLRGCIMSDNTEREALIRILVEVERGKMTEVEWKVASLTPANGIRADAILAEFLPEHDKRVKAEGWDEGLTAGLREANDKARGVVNNPALNPYERRES